MAKVLKFEATCEDCLSLAKQALEKNDMIKHVGFLKRALEIDPSCDEASITLAQAYVALGAIDISNDVLFKALSLRPHEYIKAALFMQLAMNSIDDGSPDVAEYYMRNYADDFDIEEEVEKRDMHGMHLTSSRGEDYFNDLIDKTYDLVREGRYDEAFALLDEADCDPKYKEEANHVALVCLMLKDDVDGVIFHGTRMLKQFEHSVPIGTTLVKAYMMKGDMQKAKETVCGMLEYEFEDPRDIMALLPIFIHLGMHEQIAKYARRLTDKQWKPIPMLWLGMALFNLGRNEEAKEVMRDVKMVYGKYTAAEYYLDFFEEHPDATVEYSVTVPHEEVEARVDEIQKVIDLPQKVLAKYLSDEENAARFKKLADWALFECPDEFKTEILKKLSPVNLPCVDDFFKQEMISGDMTFEMMAHMLTHFLEQSKDVDYIVEMDVVAQERFKNVRVYLPDAFFYMPKVLHTAVIWSITDIVYTDEEPDDYLFKLYRIVNKVVWLDGEGNLAYRTETLRDNITRFKSARTLAGAFLREVYEEEESKDDILERYDLEESTFDKYYDALFGEDNDDGRKE